MQVSEKITENSERLARQEQLGFELGTSRLPVLSATTTPLVGLKKNEISTNVFNRIMWCYTIKIFVVSISSVSLFFFSTILFVQLDSTDKNTALLKCVIEMKIRQF